MVCIFCRVGVCHGGLLFFDVFHLLFFVIVCLDIVCLMYAYVDFSYVDDKSLCRDLFLVLILIVCFFVAFCCSEYVSFLVRCGLRLSDGGSSRSVCVVADVCGVFSTCVSIECSGVGSSVV